MKSIFISLAAIYLAAVTCDAATVPSACAVMLCPAGTECKERIINCIKAPCPPEAYCAPITHPGHCPLPEVGIIGPCVAKCTDDSDCPDNLKCCGSCPRQCQKPVPVKPLTCQTVRCLPGYVCEMRKVICKKAPCSSRPECVLISKPGRCPPQKLDIIGPCALIAKCVRDSDCPAELKCCGSCPRQCQKPEIIKPPTCETLDCKPGYICKMRTIYCFRTPCPPPVPYCAPISKPGRCPPQKLDIIGPCALIAKCERDSDCPADLKCCGSCPRQCQKPEIIKPPTCETLDCKPGYICKMRTIYCFRAPCPPAVPYCAPISKPGRCPPQKLDISRPCPLIGKCVRDSDCPADLKCCGSCPRQCQKPEIIQLPTCETIDCKPGYICKMRTIYCFRAPCPPPVPYCAPIRKPGVCPRREINIATRCHSECKNDQECPGKQKCCGRCHRRCEHPITTLPAIKPGRCPLSTFPGICQEVMKAECGSDTDCPGKQKCCGSCPRVCKDPQIVKPGRCPVSRRPCFPGVKDECSNDSECRGPMKCCKIACHNKCAFPYRLLLN